MQRLETNLSGGPAIRVFGALLALVVAASACGGDEDCSVTNSCPNQAPAVTISSPGAGTMVDEFQTVTFTGSATDPEDGALTGSALVWTSSIDGALGTGTSFTRDDLSPGSHVVTLTATDGEGRAGTATRNLTVTDVPNEKPAVTITQPADGGSAASGESVTFSGSATDPEEGALTGAALVWTSDLDGPGPIGTGTSFSTSALSGGMHEIVLTATDGEGAFGADTISFMVTGAPSIAITAPTEQASGAPNTVLVGASVTFTGSATDAEDGALTGSSLVWTSNMDGQIGTGASFNTSSLSAGMHTVTLTATDSDANESKETVLVIVKPAAAAGYQIEIRLSEGVELTPSQQTAVTDAVTKLQAIITGDVADLATTDFGVIGNCGGATVPHLQESVDDVIIYLEFVPIDGPNGTVGSAGPCLVRSPGTALTLVGGMRFDTADLATLEGAGLMDEIILHEMMHVLGFGIFWEQFGILEEPSDPTNSAYTPGMTDTHFTGANAIAQFNAIGGGSYTGGQVVPVENDTLTFSTGSLDGHWRESVFDEELMTPAANLGANPVSLVTIGSFEDLGYTVDYGAADTYSQTFSFTLDAQGETPGADAPRIDLSGDVWRGPIQAVDPDGRRHRIR